MTAVTDQDPTEHTGHTTGEAGRAGRPDQAGRADQASAQGSRAEEASAQGSRVEHASAQGSRAEQASIQEGRSEPASARAGRAGRGGRSGQPSARPADEPGRAGATGRTGRTGPGNGREPDRDATERATARGDDAGDATGEDAEGTGRGAPSQERGGERHSRGLHARVMDAAVSRRTERDRGRDGAWGRIGESSRDRDGDGGAKRRAASEREAAAGHESVSGHAVTSSGRAVASGHSAASERAVASGHSAVSERAVGGPLGSADGGEGAWGDGLIARRVDEKNGGTDPYSVVPSRPAGSSAALMPLAYDGQLRSRLDALRELVGLSRTRLDTETLGEAGRVLDEAAARRRLSGQHTVVAIAGATGSGKSQLFNTLAGVTISETGVRRPTTAAPIACSWSDGAASLLDRLSIPGRLRRRPIQHPDSESPLRGLVLIDLPDHDSAAVQHREQVDRILRLVDAVIWVVDPEKYADAVLHERYLRPMAGHAEVTFVVLNQVDRLPGEAAEQVLDDLRRLLDEDGIALGEHGEPGATVLALSALTGEGIGELRETLGQFVAERQAPARRISADVDAAARELRPVYVTGQRTGLSEEAREEFADRLADAVGATAAGEAAERAWLRNANRACGTPWLRLWRWYHDRREPPTGRLQLRAQADEEATARQRVEQAVRTVSERASAGLPAPWAQAMREAAVRGAQGLPEALDELAVRTGLPPGRPPRPGWWPVAVLAQASMTLLQVVGGLWLLGQIIGFVPPNLGVPVLLMLAGIIGGPLIEWSCRIAARGPARRYGHEAERLLREAAAGCGRARVLDPLAAELLRYREVREQYGRVTGVGAAAR
ncbi:50S ribosome-binding GTPase [Streptomyces sp. DH17]|nr:50S ribosome-binding GTPase [Streptomyces sp. DH17]